MWGCEMNARTDKGRMLQGTSVLELFPEHVEIPERIGFLHEDKAAALGRLMAVDGQRDPIKVARNLPSKSVQACIDEGKKPYRLVTGMHRLTGALMEGITTTHRKTYDKVRTAGASGPVKAFLSEEDLMFGLTLLDLTLEQYQLALNGNTVTTVAPASGQPGTKKIGLSEDVGRTKEYALLARGLSPYDETLAMQYCIPRCFQSGAPAPVFRKGGTGAGLALTFEALEDLTAANAQERFGYILAAHLPAI